MDQSPGLALYRFFIDDLFRQQAHVLDEAGERLLSLSSRLGGVPQDAYSALSTADAHFPTITLTTGEAVQVSYGQYRRLLATCRQQADRRAAYEALYDTYSGSLNTYAALYNGVMQREWFEARARGHESTLAAALFGNNIPPAVVLNLIQETKAGVEPFRRYHRLRKRILGLDEYFAFDGFVPLVDYDVRYQYEQVLDWITESVRPL
jgi:oligoendopeptidase F